MPDIGIDLHSDTQTRPTPEMRAAMAAAPVGDEQRGEDPSVNRLCATVADMLGKEAAMFLPSGTMCNQIAILVHCRPGDEIIAAADSHIVGSEGAGRVVDRAIQIHGGIGVSKDLPLERWYRELRIRRIGEGPSEVQRIIMARDLLSVGSG